MAFTSIETILGTGLVNLVIDLGPGGAAVQDGIADQTDIKLNNTADTLEVYLNEPTLTTPYFTILDSLVNSLTVLGSTDADTLRFHANSGGALPGEDIAFPGMGAPPVPAASR